MPSNHRKNVQKSWKKNQNVLKHSSITTRSIHQHQFHHHPVGNTIRSRERSRDTQQHPWLQEDLPRSSPAFHPSGRSIPTVRNFGPAPDYHEINCQSQFHPRSVPRKERQRGRERERERERLFDTTGPTTAARYHGVASIPHPRSRVSIRKQPVVSARNVSPTLHASFSRQAWFNRKKFGIYRGHRTRLVSNRGWFHEISILVFLAFLGDLWSSMRDRLYDVDVVNKWDGDSWFEGMGVWRNLWFEAWTGIVLENVDISPNGYILRVCKWIILRYKLENCYYNETVIIIVYYYYCYKISSIVIAYYVV